MASLIFNSEHLANVGRHELDFVAGHNEFVTAWFSNLNSTGSVWF